MQAGAAEKSSLWIVQSGKSSELSLNVGLKLSGTGDIDGKSIEASFRAPAPTTSKHACGQHNTVELTATLNQHDGSVTMTGTFSESVCPTCKPLKFTATREPRGTPERKQ
jgi:hypothetical protein